MCLGTRHLKFLDATIDNRARTAYSWVLECVWGVGGREGDRGKDERISFKGMPSRASLFKKNKGRWGS